ncbi:MAG: hypothetical protein GOVbin1782_2 [Prokaryotic dsDNA virus sp.]|nr:MAG: hypothetical protein GOVbin1782_2 [Prokaryotic dsDNA virus sp.]|tara:strand:+ start:7282 stop:7473 length:192 start_codon:yes stop_codon:yes gene_type:complete
MTIYIDEECDICGLKMKENVVGIHYHNVCVGCLETLVKNAVHFQKFIKGRKMLGQIYDKEMKK